jgi:hypothetical protein
LESILGPHKRLKVRAQINKSLPLFAKFAESRNILPQNFYARIKQELKPKPNRDSTPSPPPLQSDSREKVNKKPLADFSPVEQI